MTCTDGVKRALTFMAWLWTNALGAVSLWCGHLSTSHPPRLLLLLYYYNNNKYIINGQPVGVLRTCGQFYVVS